MIHFVYKNINRFSNVRTMTVLLMLSFALMFVVNFIDLPNTVPRIIHLSGGTGILDTELTYSSVKAYQVLNSQQTVGRHAYLKFLTTFDMIFPLIYSLALSVTITVLFRLIFSSIVWIQKLSLVPLIAGMFDYLENIAIIIMLTKYPVHVDGIACIAGYFTLGKWIFSFISLLFIVIGLINMLIARRRT